MSEEPKKRKKAVIVRGPKAPRQSERLRQFELRKISPKPLPDLPVLPVVEVQPAPPVPLPLPTSVPVPPPEPIDLTSQRPIDYDRIFEELARRKLPPAEAEEVVDEIRAEEPERPIPTTPFEPVFRQPPTAVEPAPRPELLPAADIAGEEREVYRRYERRNTEALKASLRALDHEEAILNGQRVDQARFSEWYRRRRTHALSALEEYYRGQLLGGRSFDEVRSALLQLNISASATFNLYEVDHVITHLTAFWVRERRLVRYERRGVSALARSLSDVYSGLPKVQVRKILARNRRLGRDN